MNCDVCHQGKFSRQKLGLYDLGSVLGLEGAVLLDGHGLVCDHCGAVMLDGGVIDQAGEILNMLLVSRAGPLRPAEVRYLRKELEMTQAQLAECLGVHRVSVARWETGEVTIGQAESMALRAMVAMTIVERRPLLSREIAEKFMHPTARGGAYEITLPAA